MTKRQIITILAPYSWSAAIVPVIVTTLFFLYQGGQFRLDLFLAILLAAILGQSFTNVVNCYSDFMSGLDNEDTIFNSAGSILVTDKLDPKKVKRLMFYLFIISTIPMFYLSSIRGPIIFFLGVFGAFLGIIYSTGPKPLSTTPIGEVYSGIIDGVFISSLSYFIYSGDFSWDIVIVSLPAVFWITTMTFTNSICDMEKDKPYRTTLALLLGKTNSILALKTFYIGMFISLGINIFIGLLPPSMLLISFTIPIIWRRLNKINGSNTNMENKFPIMGLSCGSGVIFFKAYTIILTSEILWEVIR